MKDKLIKIYELMNRPEVDNPTTTDVNYQLTEVLEILDDLRYMLEFYYNVEFTNDNQIK
jgi:hypothetical protein